MVPAPALGLDPEEMAAVVKRLRRAQGQVTGIIRMLEEGRDCESIVTQLAAASTAVDRAGFMVISSGLRQCLIAPAGSDEAGVATLQRLFLSLT